ncbi:MAG: penicillin-binding protein 2 [Fimbriimonadaceae bacterium]|nr:penicillin-binding protein 2 [Fimbriimonadaceae bacterium]
MDAYYQTRTALLARCFLGLAGVVLLRLTWMQVLHPERYENPTRIRYHREHKLAAQKGELLDREGRCLARCELVASIAANPQQVVDAAAAAKLLAPLLRVPQSDLTAALGRRWRQVLLRRDVTAAVVQQLQPLVDRKVLRLERSTVASSFSLYVFGQQFLPSPADRQALAVVLGCQPDELDRLSGLPATAVRLRSDLDAESAKRVQQLGLTGLLVQQNPGRAVVSVWLQPSAAQIIQTPNREGVMTPWATLDPAVWADLTPLWQGAEVPDKGGVEARLRAPFVYLQREVAIELGDAVTALIQQHPQELAGVSVHREYARRYPQGEVARGLLGRCDVDEHGLSGLEQIFNQILSGVDGYRKVTVSALGRPILQEREELVPAVHGKLVELTLDSVIQHYGEQAVEAAVKEFDADWGLAVVCNPRNGEVLALVDVASAKYDVPRNIRCLATAYEPGSIMKPLVVASALEAGYCEAHSGYYCGGRRKVGSASLNCIKQHGPESVADAVRDSCNMVLIELGLGLGEDRLRHWFKKLGLLSRTGLGQAGQEACGGVFEHTEDGHWTPQKVATVSYGKGIQTTAVALCRAYSALLNGGRMPELHLVRRLRERDGTVVVEHPADQGTPVFSAATARAVSEMMHQVVADREGTGQLARSSLYDIGGKTGTSVEYRTHGQRIVSFVGYAPAKDPQLLVLMSVCEPREGARMGASTCGPAVRQILEQSLQYLNVPPLPQAPSSAPGEATP